eukprot:TRINITY_DN5097_c0_g1_i1.p1 TRINITY_DN5097_c0_g1~~TRINITY_DN5097_c0_g1_i1.p1  ORF type:complete len:549 (+),score=119.43 TRINITY_DN5097_c0_g1_i1:51-1697(+)
MALFQLVLVLLAQIQHSAEAKVPSDCGQDCAVYEEEDDVLLAEEESSESSSLHLLQRRGVQRVQEDEESEALPHPFNIEGDMTKLYAASLNDDLSEETPPPLTPIVIANHKKRHSINLHFDAVATSCGTKLSDPARCDKVVSKSASSIFTQLHVKARIENKMPPLTKEETKNFKTRFEELVVGSSKQVVTMKTRSQQYDGWKKLVNKGYSTMRPVVPKALALYVNKLHEADKSPFRVNYDDVFVKVPVALAKQKLGFKLSEEDEAAMKNDSASFLQEDDEQREAMPSSFDVREHWPNCKPVTGHVRYQTCNNCWSHSTALITESRLCIQSNGEFNGANAWLSQSFIAACRMDGHNYCNGGSGLLGFKTVTRWGVPTGGPDYRGNMKAGVQTCYPQILPHESHVRCPGSCSPYVHYSRPLQKDLFYVQYTPRALHPHGSMIPYAVKTALMQEGPILLGMRIYQDFYAYKDGIYKPTRKSWNHYMGGHAVTGMGFGPNYMLAINSWSTAWGMKGAFHVAPEAVDFGYFLPGHPLGAHGSGSYPMPLPSFR